MGSLQKTFFLSTYRFEISKNPSTKCGAARAWITLKIEFMSLHYVLF